MKIIQYLPYSYHIHTGGLEKIAQTISDRLQIYDDVEIINITSDIRRGLGKNLDHYSDTMFIPAFDLVYNFPVPKFWSRKFWKVFQIVNNKKPDIIITHTRFFIQSFIGGLLAKGIGCRRVHIEHGSGFLTGYPWYINVFAWIFDWTIGLWVFRQCNQIVTISQTHKSFIKKFTNKNPIVIYNPIDFIPQEKIKNDIISIGFLASLLPRKGCDLLIKALKDIKNRKRNCIIIGDGLEKKKLEQLVIDFHMEDRIKFVGADDRSNRLHKFDIFVNPSYQEGLPTTVVEALIAKCIVIATNVGGTNEISNKEDLILIQPGKINEIKQGLLLAFERLDQSGKSYNGVIDKFGVDSSIKKYKEILFSK